jgi:hypothetical protein
LPTEDADWLQTVLDCLFGADFAVAASRDDDNAEQAILLARLTIDPQAGFSDDERWRAIRACCSFAVQQKRHENIIPIRASREVLRVLLSCEPPAERQRIVESFVASVLEADADALTFGDTPLSDLTPLSKLPKLRILDLSGTSVSDLTPLSGLVRIVLLLS